MANTPDTPLIASVKVFISPPNPDGTATWTYDVDGKPSKDGKVNVNQPGYIQYTLASDNYQLVYANLDTATKPAILLNQVDVLQVSRDKRSVTLHYQNKYKGFISLFLLALYTDPQTGSTVPVLSEDPQIGDDGAG